MTTKTATTKTALAQPPPLEAAPFYRPMDPSTIAATAKHVASISAALESQTRREGQDSDVVYRSWLRSANTHRIDPVAERAPLVLSECELRPLQDKSAHLIESAQVELDHLYSLVRPARYVVLLADKDGVVIDHRGEPKEDARFRSWGSWTGGVWSEEAEGTNGIGTSLVERRPVTVHKAQHFRARHIGLSCSGAPIFDDHAELLGVLCVTSIDPNTSEYAHAMADALSTATARDIEERLFREKFRSHWIIAMRDPNDTAATMFFAVDRDRRIAGAGRFGKAALSRWGHPPEGDISICAVFECVQGLFRHAGQGDLRTQLTPIGTRQPWPAIVTPPIDRSARLLPFGIGSFLTRPRLALVIAGRERPAAERIQGGLPPAVVRRVRDYVDSHLDQNIDLRALAAEAGLSAYHFARSFKASAGVTPHRFVTERRLAKARELLREKDIPLSEIAVAIGFADQSHFSRRFRDAVGMSPGQFRKLAQ